MKKHRPKSSSPRRRRPALPRRSGSVIIMVVALLVLMALIGTAYIATTRNDRVSSAQNGANTQADLLVQGVVAQVATELAGTLFDQDASNPPRQYYRPAGSYKYTHFDSPI